MGATATATAKRGRGRPQRQGGAKAMIGGFRADPAFGDWLEGLVKHCRNQSGWQSIKQSDVQRNALLTFAAKVGYAAEPPSNE